MKMRFIVNFKRFAYLSSLEARFEKEQKMVQRRQENKEAIKSLNEITERSGLFGVKFRAF